MQKIKTPYFFIPLLFWSCEAENVSFEKYEGPKATAENITTVFSDSSVVKLILKAPLQHELQNNDREFPKGLTVDFYDNKNEKSSTLTAEYGYFFEKDALYKVTGNVIIQNQVKNEKLQAEELFWKPSEQKVYTDKFVRIETPKEIVMGEGLEANEDFSSYKIKKPTATLTIDESE